MATCAAVASAHIQPRHHSKARPTAGVRRQAAARHALLGTRERPPSIGDWKLVAKTNAAWELYDLAADRVESNDLAGQMPAKVSELSAKWEALGRQTNVLPWPPIEEDPPRKRK